jgi:hypothetical protein
VSLIIASGGPRLRGGLIPIGRGASCLLNFENKTTVEFANHCGQIFHDFLPLGGVAYRVLPRRDALWSHTLASDETGIRYTSLHSQPSFFRRTHVVIHR